MRWRFTRRMLQPKQNLFAFIIKLYHYVVVYGGILSGYWEYGSRGQDLNLRPADYKSAALPTELPRQC